MCAECLNVIKKYLDIIAEHLDIISLIADSLASLGAIVAIFQFLKRIARYAEMRQFISQQTLDPFSPKKTF